MERRSLLGMGAALFAVVVGLFVVLWIFIKIWVAFGLLAVFAILLGFAWWYDRREKRARAGIPPA